MLTLRYLNLAVRFLLELCILVSLGYWGFQNGKGAIVKIGLGIGAPLLAAVVWGTFLSPKASVPLPASYQLLLELAVFGSAAAALLAAGRPLLSAAFVLVAVINRILLYIWKQ